MICCISGYNDRSPYDSMSRPYDQYSSKPMYDDSGRDPPDYEDDIRRSEVQNVGAPPEMSEPDGMRRSPSTDSQSRGQLGTGDRLSFLYWGDILIFL